MLNVGHQQGIDLFILSFSTYYPYFIIKTELRYHIVSNLPSYSGDPGIKIRPGHRLSCSIRVLLSVFPDKEYHKGTARPLLQSPLKYMYKKCPSDIELAKCGSYK